MVIAMLCLTLAGCSEIDELEQAEVLADRVLIECSVADFGMEVSDGTRAATRAMAYDDNQITKLDLMIFEANPDAGDNYHRLLKHLTASNLSEVSGTYQWDVTGQLPKDYLKNKYVTLYLIANYYPSDHGGETLDNLDPGDEATFFRVASEDPFPPGDMLNHGIVMTQVVTGSKNDVMTEDANHNIIFNFNSLERVMAKAEFFFKGIIANRLEQSIDFENDATYTEGWVKEHSNRTTLSRKSRNKGGETSNFLYIDHTQGQNSSTVKYTIANTNFNKAKRWRMEMDFAGYNALSNDSWQVPYLDILDGNGNQLLNIAYNNRPINTDNGYVAWAFNNANTNAAPTVNPAGAMGTASISMGSNLKTNGTNNVSYSDKTATLTRITPNAKKISVDKETSFLSFKFKPAAGVKFTPKKLSFKTARFGTGGGTYDIYVKQNGSENLIMEGYRPERPGDKNSDVSINIKNPSGGTGKYLEDDGEEKENSNGHLDSYRGNEEVTNLTMTVGTATAYKVSFDYGTALDNVSATFKIADSNGNNVYTEEIVLPETAGWRSYVTLTGSTEIANLPAGNYVMSIKFSNTGGYTANIKNLKLVPVVKEMEDDNDGMDGNVDAGTEISISSFNLDGMAASEEEVEVIFYIYNLDPDKNVGFCDIAIDGTFIDEANWNAYDQKAATATFNGNTASISLDARSAGEYWMDNAQMSTWYHLMMESNGESITCKITDANGNTILQNQMEENGTKPSAVLCRLGRADSKWAVDDIKLYTLYDDREITAYKVLNYTNGYTLFNINESDKSTETEIRNSTADGYTTTGFKDLASHPDKLKDPANNSFAFYFYPNYWYDPTKKDNMAEEEPILFDRQTHVLIKGTYNGQEYFYKVPVNYRLPKYSDAHVATNHFDAKIDEICDTQYPTTEDQWTNTFYNYVLNYMYYTYETCSEENKTKLRNACIQLYNAASTAGDKEKAKTAVKNLIGSTDIYNVFKEKNETEVERLCRIQRNHHYKVTLNIDKMGGVTEDEAVYIFPEPYGNITARPEF